MGLQVGNGLLTRLVRGGIGPKAPAVPFVMMSA